MPIDTLKTGEALASNNESPHPARRDPFLGRARKRRLLFTLFASLAMLLILHVALAHISNVPPRAITCADLLHETDYTREVGLQPDNQQMAAVQMFNSLDGGSPVALVQVTARNTQNTLNISIFGCTTRHQQPQLALLFTRRGLSQGTVEFSPAHTLVTGVLDTNLSPNDVPFLQPLQQNIYQEYTWQRDHFVQTLFPGLYPVSSRAEAEALQQNFNRGQRVLWDDPLATAQQMARDLLQWSSPSQARLIAQAADTTRVELSSRKPHIVLEVTLKRLIQGNRKGLWFVTDAHTRGMIISQAGTLHQPFPTVVTSPLSFAGVRALIDGHTSATLFDHTLTPLREASRISLHVQPDSSYVGTLTYSNLIKGQQGLLLIESLPLPQNEEKEAGQLLLTSAILN